MKFLLGRKRGMTQLFGEGGRVISATVLEAGPCVVTQVKTPEKDGYPAVQIGFEDIRESKLTKPMVGHFKKSNSPPKRFLREEKVKGEISLKIGDQIRVDCFEKGDLVDVIGKSKGKGFQGTVRAHGFKMGARSHGSMNIRQPGSVGAGTGMSRILKGLRMAKHLGDKRTTAKNLEVVRVVPEKNLLYVRGSVPGMGGTFVIVRQAKTGVKKLSVAKAASKAGKGKK